MGRFRDLALKTLEENNPTAAAEMRKAGTLEPFLAKWVINLKASIATRHETKFKAGAANPALEAEMEAVADALDADLFRGPA